MNGMTLICGAIVVLWIGYRFYGRWLAKTWGFDDSKPTPAMQHDAKGASSRLSAFAHQFTSITGAGPVTGPIIAAMFGWLPALLWMVFGGIFFGAVQDFTALYASVKNGGKTIGHLIEQYVGRMGRQLFLLFCWLFTLLVIAAFCDIVVKTFNGFTATGETIMPNAAAGSISVIYMFGAILFGIYIRFLRPSPRVQLYVGILLMIAMVWLGIAFPLYLDTTAWRTIVYVYLFAASTMPMWLLKQPRDYLSMFLLLGMIASGVIGVVWTNPSINIPAFVGWEVNNLDLFPILFVTVACGAVSGFHSLVSSGTTSRIISKESDMLPVGYGAMLVECVLGVVALIVVCAAASNGALPKGTPFQLFSTSVSGFLTQIFGVPEQIAACILTMCVSALALTSVDAVARIGRISLQEFFTPKEGVAPNAIQKVMTNSAVATVLTLGCSFALGMAGYMSIWPLFGSANQLLSALVLTALAVFLQSTGRKGWMLYIPMTIMFIVTMTALVMNVVKNLTALANGTFVFMINGLQLILAIALIILSLLVVYHCVRKLFTPSAGKSLPVTP